VKLLVDLENNVSEGIDMYPATFLEAYQLAQNLKRTRPRSMETSKPLAVYVVLNRGGRGNGKVGRAGAIMAEL
jgi:hypothetical protein